MLKVDDLTIAYNGREIVSHISINIRPGEIMSIIGPSGSGKSSILNAINGMLGKNGEIRKGSIYLDGQALYENGAYTARLSSVLGRSLAAISQYPDKSLDPLFKIKYQMTEVMKAHSKISGKEAEAKSLELLSRLHLTEPERVWNAYPHELSGGMCQRVAVAMALANHAQLLLADEPTSAIDVTSQSEFIKLLKEITREQGLAVLLVTHNMQVAKALSDQIGVLKNGKLSIL